LNIDERAVIAADNNADLYEAVFSSQGLRYERLPFGFVANSKMWCRGFLVGLL